MALFKLPQMLRLAASLLTDRRVSVWLKLGAAAGVAYVFSPLDVIPDFTGIGVLDDIVVSILIVQTLIDLAPDHVVDEHCSRLGLKRAELDMDVPGLIGDAVELVAGWWAGASAARAAFAEDLTSETKAARTAARATGPDMEPSDRPSGNGTAAATTSETARMRVEAPAADEPEELPKSIKRYSAYREDQN